jgi:hypothetical protein
MMKILPRRIDTGPTSETIAVAQVRAKAEEGTREIARLLAELQAEMSKGSTGE